MTTHTRRPFADGRRDRHHRSGAARIVATLVLAAALAACQTARSGGAGSGGAGARSAPVDPQQVIGASEGAVARLIGQPELKRREEPAEVWQYRTRSCVFDVYLYPAAGGGRSVTHVDARHRREGGVSAAACLGEIVATRGSAAAR